MHAGITERVEWIFLKKFRNFAPAVKTGPGFRAEGPAAEFFLSIIPTFFE